MSKCLAAEKDENNPGISRDRTWGGGMWKNSVDSPVSEATAGKPAPAPISGMETMLPDEPQPATRGCPTILGSSTLFLSLNSCQTATTNFVHISPSPLPFPDPSLSFSLVSTLQCSEAGELQPLFSQCKHGYLCVNI